MKKLIIFGVIAIFLVASVGIVIARGNAAPKVTGDVWFTTNDGWPRHVWFDAHEAYADRPIKGEFHQEDWCGGVFHYYHGDIIDVYVDSVNGIANFATYIYDTNNSSLQDKILYLHVVDNGEPGVGVDTIDGGLSPDYSSYDGWQIYEGNLVVHK